jgi:hypothetical protein
LNNSILSRFFGTISGQAQLDIASNGASVREGVVPQVTVYAKAIATLTISPNAEFNTAKIKPNTATVRNLGGARQSGFVDLNRASKRRSSNLMARISSIDAGPLETRCCGAFQQQVPKQIMEENKHEVVFETRIGSHHTVNSSACRNGRR